MQMQTQNKSYWNNSLEQNEEQVVLFKFKRAFNHQSFDQIKIQSKKIKPNPESSEKAAQNYRKRNFIDRETMLTNLFSKLELNNKPSQQIKSQQVFQDIYNPNQPQQKKNQYFLKKVKYQQKPQTLQNQKISDIRDQAKLFRQNIRRSALQDRFNKARGIITQQSKSRVKYKIIDIKKQNFVYLNGQKIEYQDLSEQSEPKYDYYVLSKGQMNSLRQCPQIQLPEEAEYLIDEQQLEKMKDQTPEDSSDSNREDRSDYEYPEEDYHEGDSDESEQMISGKKKNNYDSENDEDEDLRNSDCEEDQEEYYRQYLKRCQLKERGDDEMTYLYNLKPTRYYQEDSDDD